MFAKEKIMVDLNELQKRIYDNKIKKGFNTTDICKEFCYIHGEVSEAFEAYNKNFEKKELGKELADVAIYLLGLCEILGFSLEDEILKKVKINEKRIYIDGKKIEPADEE